MRSRWATLAILGTFFILSACQPTNPVQQLPEQTPPGEYPVPGQTVNQPATPYLAPGSSEPAPLSIPYPEIGEGDEIPWHQAESLIMSGYIVKVVQSQDLKITITTSDGRTMISEQPSKETVQQLVELCGEICKDITITTE